MSNLVYLMLGMTATVALFALLIALATHESSVCLSPFGAVVGIMVGVYLALVALMAARHNPLW